MQNITKEIIVRSINFKSKTYIDTNGSTRPFEKGCAYLLLNADKTHERYVVDDRGVISKQTQDLIDSNIKLQNPSFGKTQAEYNTDIFKKFQQVESAIGSIEVGDSPNVELLRDEVSDLTKALEDLETIVEELPIGQVSPDVLFAIKQQKNIVQSEYIDIINRYNAVLNDPYLFDKTRLRLSFEEPTTGYLATYNSLIDYLDSAFNDTEITKTEKDTLALKFDEYRAALNRLSEELQRSLKTIEARRATNINSKIEGAVNAVNIEISEVGTKLNGLEESYLDFASDGVFSIAEKEALKSYIELLENEKADVFAKYEEVYNNPNLEGDAKIDLFTRWDLYSQAHEFLIEQILIAISDDLSDQQEVDAIKVSFEVYRNELALLSRAFEVAINAIFDKRLTDLESQIYDEIGDVQQAITDLQTDINNLPIGSVSEAALFAIKIQKDIIASEFENVKRRYDHILADADLENKVPLHTAYGDINSGFLKAYTDLFNYLDTAFVDADITQAEKDQLQTYFDNYKTQLGHLSKALQVALDEIAAKREWDLRTMIQTQITEIENEVLDVETSLTGLRNFTDLAFLDGVIDYSEREGLKLYIKSLEAERADVGAKYDELKEDTFLSGVPEGNLDVAYFDYSTAHTGLIDLIGNAIADGIATEQERTELNEAFDNYAIKLSELSASFEYAVRFIAEQKINDLNDRVFDSSGYFDPIKIKPLSIETKHIAIGDRMQNFVLPGVKFSLEDNFASLRYTAGRLDHNSIDVDLKTWTIAAGVINGISNAWNYLYIKASRTGTTATVFVSPNQIKVEDDPDFYHFEAGYITAIIDGYRLVKTTFGIAYINPAELSIGRWSDPQRPEQYIEFTSAGLHIVAYDIYYGLPEGGFQNVRDKFGSIETQIIDETSDLQEAIDGLATDITNLPIGEVSGAALFAIEQQKYAIEHEFTDLKSRYDYVVADTDLIDKVPLQTAYGTTTTGFLKSYNDLFNYLGTAFVDADITQAEKDQLKTYLDAFRDNIAILSTAIQNALKLISLQREEDLWGLMQDELDEINLEIGDVDTRLGTLKTTYEEFASDGVFDVSEREALKVYLKSLDSEKQDIDAKYDTISTDPFLAGIPDTNLDFAHFEYSVAHTNLNTIITNAIADGISTQQERDDVNLAFANYAIKLAELSASFELALRYITQAKSEDVVNTKVFDSSGQFDGSKIKPLTVQTKHLAIGDRMQNFTLPGITFYLEDTFTSIRHTAGTIVHKTIDITPKTWTIAAAKITGISSAWNYVYIKASKTGTTATVHVTTAQLKVADDPNFFYFEAGYISALQNGFRTVKTTFGFAQINPAELSIGKWSDPSNPTQYIEFKEEGIDIVAKKIQFLDPQDIPKDVGQAVEDIETNLINLNTVRDYINNVLPGELSTIQNQIDGSITNWFYGYAPTLSNAPANAWTTTELKNIHLGDVFYDTETGYAYRFKVLSNVYSWERITDSDVTKALSDAAKAQDTADGKRRVFVVQPVPPYDIGDLWVQGSDGEIMRCATMRLSGNYVAGDWVKASKYTDDTRAIQAETNAKNYADGLKQSIDTEIGQITDSLSDLDTYVDGAFADSIIQNAEAVAIEKYLNDVDTQKADLDSRYTTIYSDTELTGTPKTDLLAKKNAYNTAHTNLKASINTAIADEKTTPTEKEDVDTKFTAYRTALANLSKSFDVAIDSIAQVKATKALTDANAFTQGKIDDVNGDITDVGNRVTGLQDLTNTAFKDGIVDLAEKESLKAQIKSLETEKTDLDNRYTTMYGNANLGGTAKTSLNAAKVDYNSKHSSLISAINTAIANDVVTPAEQTAVNTAFANYKTSLGTLATRFEEAIRYIEVKTATDLSAQARIDAQAYTDALDDQLTGEIGDLSTQLSTLQTEINDLPIGALTDTALFGIKQQKNIVQSEYSDVYNRYLVIRDDAFLVSKTALNNAYSTYNTAYTSLTGYFDVAFNDKDITQAEKNELNTRFTTYRNTLATFSSAMQTATKTIEQAKVDSAKTITSPTAPTNPIANDTVWIDTSVKPSVLKTWNGTKWVVVNETNAPNRNLALESNVPYTGLGYLIKTYIRTTNVEYNTTDEYTFTVWGIPSEGHEFRLYDTNGAVYGPMLQILPNVHQITFKFKADIISGLRVYNFAGGATTPCQIWRAKLEKGSRGTDYTVAQEDIDAAINQVQTNLDTFNTTVTGAFKDGIIKEAEAKAIEKYKNLVNTDFDNFTNQYNSIHDNTSLTGDAKTQLQSAYSNFTTSKNNLISSIDTAISDGKTDASEKADVDSKFTTYKSNVALLSTRIQEALNAISTQKVEDIQIGGRNLLRNSGNFQNTNYWNGYTSVSFVLNNSRLIVTSGSSGLPRLVNNTLIPLTDTPQEFTITVEYIGDDEIGISGKCSNSLTVFNEGGSQSIGAVEKIKTTIVEAPNRKITEFRWISITKGTALSAWIYLVMPNDAVFEIIKVKIEKGNKATDWTPAPEDLDQAISDAQTTADTANTALAEIASDSKLSPLEKQDTQKEWDIIVGEKPKLDASATEFGVSYTAYGAAYSALSTYITPLLSNLATTSNIVGATFRSTFKAYYDAKIDLLNAIASKGKLNDQVVDMGGTSKKFLNVAGFNSQGLLTGYLVITSPVTHRKMVQVSLSGYQHASSLSNIGAGNFKLDISCYHAEDFNSLSYAQTGNVNIPKVQVAKTVLGSGQLVFIIGLADTVWSYSKINLDQVIIGHQNPPDSYKDGWSIEVKTGISMYFNVTDVPGSNPIALLEDMTSDGVLDPVEKKRVRQEWEGIKSEYPNTLSQATALSVVTSSFTGAYNTLNNYITPLLSDMAINSSITRSAFINNFKAYYEAKAALQKDVSDKLKENTDNIQIGGRNYLINSSFEGVIGATAPNGWSANRQATYPDIYEIVESIWSDNVNAYHIKVTSARLYFDSDKKITATEGDVFTISAQASDEGLSAWVEFLDENDSRIHLTSTAVLTKKSGRTYSYTTIPAPTGTKYFSFFRFGVGTAGSTTGDVIFEKPKLEKGNKATDWSPAPEDIEASINQVQTNLNTFNTTITGAFKNGIIEEAESKAIEKYKNLIDADFDNITKQYTSLYNNRLNVPSVRSELQSIYNLYSNAKSTLISNINSAILDGKTTSAEKALVDSSFESYKTAIANLSTKLQEANDFIASRSSKTNLVRWDLMPIVDTHTTNYGDAGIAPHATSSTMSVMTTYLTTIGNRNLVVSKSVANGTPGSNWNGGLLTDFINLSYQHVYRVVTICKVVGSTGTIYQGTSSGQISSDKINPSGNFYFSSIPSYWYNDNDWYACVFYIVPSNYNGVLPIAQIINLTDKSVSATTGGFGVGYHLEDTAIRIRAGQHSVNNNTSELHIGEIRVEKMDGSEPSLDSLLGFNIYKDMNDMKSDYTNLINQEIGDVETKLTGLQDLTNVAFRDGLIETAEAKAIEKYINLLNAEKEDIDKEYTTIYSDPLLTGTARTNLESSKATYDTYHANLLSSINTAVSGGKTTPAQKANVDSRFATYRTGLGNVATTLQKALDAISTGKVSEVKSNIGIWTQNYTVNTANPQPLIDTDGNLLANDSSYVVTGRVTNTGTDSFSLVTFIVSNSGNFTLNKIRENGTSSNQVEFFLDNGIPSVRLYGHTTMYNVIVRIERYWGTNLPINILQKYTQDQIASLVGTLDVEYYLSTSSTSPQGSSWTSLAPAWVNGRYMFSRTKITKKDGTVSYSPGPNGTNISGAKGDTGATGANGANGATGADGRGIASTVLHYQVSTSGTSIPTGTWLTTIPTVPAGQYLWTRTTFNYTSGVPSYSYSSARQGADGSNGSNGATGPKGDKGDTGANGATGSTGRGISMVREQYYLSTSNTSQLGSSWVYAPPAWISGRYMWTRSEITYVNPAGTGYSAEVLNMLATAEQQAVLDLEKKTEAFQGVTMSGRTLVGGTLLVGNNANTTAGLDGLGTDNGQIFLWGGETYANRHNARIWFKRNGHFRMQTESGLAFDSESGTITNRYNDTTGNPISLFIGTNSAGNPEIAFYNRDGLVTWKQDPNGIKYPNTIPETWTARGMRSLGNTVALPLNATKRLNLRNTIETYMCFKVVSGVDTYGLSQGLMTYQYDAGQSAYSEGYRQYEGYKTANNSRTSNIADGWYVFSTPSMLSDGMTNAPMAEIMYITGGKVTYSENINMTKNVDKPWPGYPTC